MIPRKDFYIVGLILALALIGGMVLHAYISSKMAVVQAEQVRQDVTKQISALKSDLQAQLGQIANDRKITQPDAIVKTIPQYIPLPKPIYLAGPGTVTSDVNGSLQTLPDSPGSLVVPKESVQAFWQHEVDCKADSLKLAECQKEVPLLTQRAEAAEKAMKGGSFWIRLKGNSKWFALGGAVAAGAVCGTGHCK